MFGAMIRIQEYECCVEVSGYCGCESPQDRNGDDGLIDLNIPEAILKKKSKKKMFFFFFLSRVRLDFCHFFLLLPGNDLSLPTMSTMPAEATESFISSSREPGLMTTSH